MKRNTRAAMMLSIFTVVLAFASVTFGQIVVGGYKTIANTDEGAQAAANFAVDAQGERTQKDLDLLKVVKAERQIVAGSNYRLCIQAKEEGKEASFAQAVVYLDLQNKYTLTSWAASTCGGGAKTATAPADGFKPIENGDGGAGLAADFAAKAQAKKAKAVITPATIIKAEDQEPSLGYRNFRLCLKTTINGKATTAQALVNVDQYSNHKLVNWTEMKCGGAGDDDFKLVEPNMTAGVDLAADFAVMKHSKDTSVPHKLVEILKREEKGMFAVTYRICMKVGEEGKTQTIQAVVSVDMYSNMKLVSWEHSDCGK